MRTRLLALALACAAIGACARHPAPGAAGEAGGPPTLVVGAFRDDYGNTYSITRSEWVQHPRTRYRIVRWHPVEQYLIAQNHPDNPSAPSRWTRIDWMVLPMAPYTWAFCYTAYDAPTASAAQAMAIARRDTPRTGCNGHPFSRMQPVAPAGAPIRR